MGSRSDVLQAGTEPHRSNGPAYRACTSGSAVVQIGSYLVTLDRRIATEALDAAKDSRGRIGASCVGLNLLSESRIGDLGATVSGKRKRL